MSTRRTVHFITPKEARLHYGEIIPAYQKAFAGDPWFEVSKCAGCESGFSAQSPGTVCESCGHKTGEEAYTTEELVDRFDNVGETHPTSWYIERDMLGRLTLAAIAWSGTLEEIANERYSDNSAMLHWLNNSRPQLQASGLVWLDDIFAKRTNLPKGNLSNFGSMVSGIALRLHEKNVAYRTIATAMTHVALRDFGRSAVISRARIEVPDRRDFISIELTD